MEDLYRKILLCIDNSEFSTLATEATLSLAKAFNSSVTAVHGYNAYMHEGAFRIMEPTLPQEFQNEEVLKKQRELHNRLINIGMQKISLSYIRPIQNRFVSEGIEFVPRVKEGKNFVAINEMIKEEDPELVVLGSAGFNSNGRGFIGSVCLRLLRTNNRDFLITKVPLQFDAPEMKIVVCLDGSYTAMEALKRAVALSRRFNAELHLLYVFDSVLHKEVFARLKDAVLSEEGFNFNKKEQERMHDEFIDRGLEKVGQMILEKAESQVLRRQLSPVLTYGWGPVSEEEVFTPVVVKKVLQGHIYQRICEYAEETGASLICIGRTGRHYTEGLDIGSVAENVVRFSPCSVLVSKHEKFRGWEL